jgi:hypothetical protein
MKTTKELKAMGYSCKLETISGQGYMGGDGCQCYRVRDMHGALKNYQISTYISAYKAWKEAAQIIERNNF